MHSVIIAGEDGTLYRLTGDQIEAHPLEASSPHYQAAQGLVGAGVSHAVLPPPAGGTELWDDQPHLLNLKSFRQPAGEQE
ncbi:MAG: hypothetical protein QOH06_135 [Acidobacteriota bacterium]|jgi:hypothetical protein|nr:hypothetical protein [Acidobacteriota bacterium]